MDKHGDKRNPDTKLIPTRSRKARLRKWKLTRKDKDFLKSCNILPD